MISDLTIDPIALMIAFAVAVVLCTAAFIVQDWLERREFRRQAREVDECCDRVERILRDGPQRQMPSDE